MGIIYAGSKVYANIMQRVKDVEAKLDEAFDVVLQQQVGVSSSPLPSHLPSPHLSSPLSLARLTPRLTPRLAPYECHQNYAMIPRS